MVRIFENIIMDCERDTLSNDEALEFPLITCGLSQKSSVTASSIDDDGFVYCVQRGFYTHSGQIILPQEFKVYWTGVHENIYPYLEFVTALLLIDMKPSAITERLVFE